jgi:hypothetical protein
MTSTSCTIIPATPPIITGYVLRQFICTSITVSKLGIIVGVDPKFKYEPFVGMALKSEGFDFTVGDFDNGLSYPGIRDYLTDLPRVHAKLHLRCPLVHLSVAPPLVSVLGVEWLPLSARINSILNTLVSRGFFQI